MPKKKFTKGRPNRGHCVLFNNTFIRWAYTLVVKKQFVGFCFPIHEPNPAVTNLAYLKNCQCVYFSEQNASKGELFTIKTTLCVAVNYVNDYKYFRSIHYELLFEIHLEEINREMGATQTRCCCYYLNLQ